MAMNSNFFKMLILFTGMIAVGLFGVYYFDNLNQETTNSTINAGLAK